MKKFKFRFSSVLEVRKAKEREQIRLFGQAQQAYQGALSRKAELLAELDYALQRREDLGRQDGNASAFHVEESFIAGTKQRLIQADQAILRASREMQRALKSYWVAHKDCEVMKSLYERERLEYLKAIGKMEQKSQDDLTVMRARLQEEQA